MWTAPQKSHIIWGQWDEITVHDLWLILVPKSNCTYCRVEIIEISCLNANEEILHNSASSAGERGRLGYKIKISVIHFTRRSSVCSVILYSLRFKKLSVYGVIAGSALSRSGEWYPLPPLGTKNILIIAPNM